LELYHRNLPFIVCCCALRGLFLMLVPLLKRNLVVSFKAFSKKAVVPLQLALLIIQKHNITYW
ncbi:MAG: hypothetical protein ACRDGA_06405, partial [Bacteroidota bacterium]